MDSGPSASGVVTEEIPPALDGQRLDRVVSLITGVSRTAAKELVAQGRVLVNGGVPSERVVKLATGDEVTIELPETATEEPPAANPAVELAVVHEDEHILVIDKPPGLVVHPAPGHFDDTVVNGLLAIHPEVASVGEARRPGIVHRLDRDTSGLMTVALDPQSYSGLVEALREHRVERIYRALVHGIPASSRGVVEAPIGRSRRNRMRMAVSTEGRPARTHYEVERTFEGPVPVS
ncbi:MAG TPA: RluA family pseudouridine synthase, partial [Acidimicrobiales bacterium]|nr:RluA family pseudouridine synthase [Acidimicrobiales bacterium]